jgi:hypothetical protein
MSTATLNEVRVHIDSEDLRKGKNLYRASKDEGEIIAGIVHEWVENQGKLFISHPTLRELAARAGVRNPIRTEEDLIKVFECVTNLGKNSCVVHLEAAEIPQIAASAEGQKIPMGEAIVQYLTHAIAMGWFSERIEVKNIMFQPAEFKNLAAILGVPAVRSSEHLIKLIMGLKKQLGDAREQVRAAKEAQDALAVPVDVADELSVDVTASAGDLSQI